MIADDVVARPLMDARDTGIVPFDFVLPPELEASEPPEARGLARDDVRLLVSSRADDRIVARALPRPAGLPPRGRSARHQYERHDECGGARGPRRWDDGGGASLHPAPRRSVGGGVAHAGRGRHGTALHRHGGRDAAPAGGRRRDAPHALSRRSARGARCPGAAVGRDARRAGAAARVPRAARLPDPLPLRARPRGRSRTTRRSTPPSRAARRCPPPGAPSPRS